VCMVRKAVMCKLRLCRIQNQKLPDEPYHQPPRRARHATSNMFIGENTALISSHLTQVGNMRVSQHRYAGAPFSSLLLLFWHGSLEPYT
jgi:hypothetical protein